MKHATTTKTIHEKLINIQAAVTTIGKSGFNSFHNYEYVMVNDILFALRPMLQSEGITLMATVAEYDISDTDASCRVVVTLTDIESGEQLQFSGVGYSKDAKGDKAIFKAETGAFKYALILGFGLDTDSMDEPEHTAHDIKGGTTRKPAAVSNKRKPSKGSDDDFDI